MRNYLIKRILSIIPVLLLIAVASFSLLYLIPGDPVLAILGPDANTEDIAKMRSQLGLDRPLLVQFTYWFGNLLQGELGNSIISGRPISLSLMEKLPVTLALAITATFISLIIALPAGILAAVKQNTWVDKFFMLISMAGISVPNFWLGLLLLLFFAVILGWLPTGSYVALSDSPWQWFRHIILPAFALGAVQAAVVARMMRSSMLEVLRNDFIRFARAKGLKESVVINKHALKNSLIPVVTVVGLNFGHLLGNTVVIETIFSLPGIGSFLVFSVFSRDYPVIQSLLLIIGAMYSIINLAVDMLYSYLDPRIHYR